MNIEIEPVEVPQLRIVEEAEWNKMVDKIRELESFTRCEEDKPKDKQLQIKVNIEESFISSREELIKELTKELISNSII
jgi:hypothetical protein